MGSLKKEEAELLYAGIILDTKRFSINTGVRTFTAALYLRARRDRYSFWLEAHLAEALRVALVGIGSDAGHLREGLAREISVGEASARECRLEGSELRGICRAPLVEQSAVDRRYCVDVLGRLHSSLDLQGRRAGGDQLLDMRCQRQIRERERIPLAKGKSAGLGAFAAVAASAADKRGEETLPRVTYAERAVEEHLGLDRRALRWPP